MKKTAVLMMFLGLSLAWAENFMVIDKKGVQTKVRIGDIDSIFFIQSANPLYGTILYTRPFYHWVEEFNTSAISGFATDNNFGIWDPTGGTLGRGDAAQSTLGSLDAAMLSSLATDIGMFSSVKLTSVYNSQAIRLGINVGDTLFVQATILSSVSGSDETELAKFVVIEDPTQSSQTGAKGYRVATLQQFLLCVQNFLSQGAWNGGTGSDARGAKIGIFPNGKIIIENASGSNSPIKDVMITSSNQDSKALVAAAFSFGAEIPDGGSKTTAECLLRPAKANDCIYEYLIYDVTYTPFGDSSSVQVFNDSGKPLDILNGDTLSISAQWGGIPRRSSTYVFQSGNPSAIHSSDKLQDFAQAILSALQLPALDNTAQNNPSVSIDPAGSADLLPDGAIIIRGQPDLLQKITSFSCTAGNDTVFNANMTAKEY